MIVATFDPHPVRFFKPDVPPFRLTTLDQREALFAHAGADAMLVFEFDARARLDGAPRNSSPRCSREQIGAAGVVTGDDFTFGKGRSGNVALLQDARRRARHRRRSGRAGRCSTASAISSGRIREALVAGDTGTRDAHAEPRLMRSRAWSSAATQRGRELGYPTANLDARRLSAARNTASMRCA